MGEGEGLPGDSVSCQEMAEMEGEKRLHLTKGTHRFFDTSIRLMHQEN